MTTKEEVEKSPMFKIIKKAIMRKYPWIKDIYVGDEEDLMKKEMHVAKMNYIKYAGINDGMEATIRIRYKDMGSAGTLHNNDTGIRVSFYENAKGIAPGQSAVFYEGDDVIGGGIIQRTDQ